MVACIGFHGIRRVQIRVVVDSWHHSSKQFPSLVHSGIKWPSIILTLAHKFSYGSEYTSESGRSGAPCSATYFVYHAIAAIQITTCSHCIRIRCLSASQPLKALKGADY
jgi:hypothetical protein